MHRDGQALVTAVVSLSEYGRDFGGGLYVAANGRGRQTIALREGDAVFHQYASCPPYPLSPSPSPSPSLSPCAGA